MKARIILALSALALGGCATYTDVKDLKLVGFTDDVTKGKSVGMFESDDCSYHVLGYPIGGQPEVARAIANARTRKRTTLADATGTAVENEGVPLRYATNITTSRSGFNAVIFGKSCITVKGMGYL